MALLMNVAKQISKNNTKSTNNLLLHEKNWEKSIHLNSFKNITMNTVAKKIYKLLANHIKKNLKDNTS